MKRLDYIDIAKGILIILVVIGHILTGESYIRSWIWTFHMPAFFVISGILINHSSFTKKSLSEVFISLFQTCIIPYIVFEIIGALSCRITHLKIANLNGYLYDSLTVQCNNIVDWFLITLFISEIIVYFLLKLQNKKAEFIISILFLVFGVINFNTILCRSFIATFFIILGYLGEQFLTKGNKYVTSICFLLVSYLAIANGRVDLNNMIFHNPVLYIIGSVAGSALTLSMSKHISNRIISCLGKHSLLIMGIHTPIIELIRYLH